MDDFDQKIENNHLYFNEAAELSVDVVAGRENGRSLPDEAQGGGKSSDVDPPSSTNGSELTSPEKSSKSIKNWGRRLLSHIIRPSIVESDEHPVVKTEDEQRWSFASKGLYVNIAPSDNLEELMYGIPPGTLVGKLDFAPHGRKKYNKDDATRYENMLWGIQGLQDFFAAVDDGNPAPQYMYGVTNKEMARAAKRLGFEKPERKSAKYAPTDDKFEWLTRKTRIFAKTEKVKTKLDQMLARKSDSGSGRPAIVERLEESMAAAKVAQAK